MEKADVYDLRPLLYPALPLEAGVNPTSPAALGRSLRCAEPFGDHLYLGSTDGHVFCFKQPLSQQETRLPVHLRDLQHVGTRHISSKPIERITILALLGIGIVQSESTLTFHELPSFLPIPQQVLPHIKGVATFALDDQELFRGAKGLDSEGLANLCIVRRKVIMLVKFGKDTWRVVKEIPLPGGATSARRFGDWLCISTTSEYNVVNLKEATLSSVGLPISQTTSAPSASSRPSILSIASNEEMSRCEFLITSHSEELTLGVFISQEGEPTAKLLEWPSHPRMLSLDYPYIHALLRNDTIEVHNLVFMEKQQTIHLPSLLEPRTLSNATSQLELVEAADQIGMSTLLIRPHVDNVRQKVEKSTKSWRSEALTGRHTRSRVLMVGKNAVQGMCRTKILDSAVRALHRGDVTRAQQAADLAWEQRLEFEERSVEAMELEYLNQMLAVECLRLLRFEEAGKFMRRGRLDYRVVLSLFPCLISGLEQVDEEEVEVFARVIEIVDEIDDLETYPEKNIELNYCPPLSLDTNNTLQELLGILKKRIETLRDTLIDSFREDALLRQNAQSQIVLNTVYAKILIKKRDTNALSSFLAQHSSTCEMSLIEPELAGVGCYAILASLFEQRKEWPSVLELHTRLLDGDLKDDHFRGTTQGVSEILQACPDAELVHKYSIWLVQRDAAAGVKILTKGRGGLKDRNDQDTLKELQSIDEKAAMAFLEAISLTRKQQSAEAHTELARVLLRRIHKSLSNRSQRELMQKILDTYVEGAYAESFVSHLALHASSTPLVVDRIKMMALLQASVALDVPSLLSEVEREPLLDYERAILLGRLRNDVAALELLAVQLRDANSAETYCSQEGRPLSSVALQSIEGAEIKVYSAFVSRSLRRGGSQTDQLGLLKTLLNVYMRKGIGGEFQIATTHLLNTQAMHLSTQEILSTVPTDWTVQTLETFLSRSLRREMHRTNEGHIQRATALAQNLEVGETLWSKRRGLGGVIEDGSEQRAHDGQDDGEGRMMDDDDDDVGRALVEKVQEAEKQALSVSPSVSDVALDGEKRGRLT